VTLVLGWVVSLTASLTLVTDFFSIGVGEFGFSSEAKLLSKICPFPFSLQDIANVVEGRKKWQNTAYVMFI